MCHKNITSRYACIMRVTYPIKERFDNERRRRCYYDAENGYGSRTTYYFPPPPSILTSPRDSASTCE